MMNKSKFAEEKRKNIYVYALAFSNLGFMGNAILKSVFGDDILFDYMIFTLFFNILIYSYGMMLLIPDKSISGKSSGLGIGDGKSEQYANLENH